jgi:hypothetical protein
VVRNLGTSSTKMQRSGKNLKNSSTKISHSGKILTPVQQR